MSGTKVFGATYSVYVRAVRLALAAKRADYELVPVDIFSASEDRENHRRRHPFLKIPAFEHEGFRLYETDAILRFIDEAFPGRALQPVDLFRRARMNQGIGVLNAYAYRSLVWGVFEGDPEPARKGRKNAAIPSSARCLAALEDILGDEDWFGGSDVSLADLLAIPMFAYFVLASEAGPLLDDAKGVARWWERAKTLPWLAETRPEEADAAMV